MGVFLTTEEVQFALKTVEDTKELLNRYSDMVIRAVDDIYMLGRMGANICPVCAHYNHGAGDPEHCPKALKEDCFEWRGVQNG